MPHAHTPWSGARNVLTELWLDRFSDGCIRVHVWLTGSGPVLHGRHGPSARKVGTKGWNAPCNHYVARLQGGTANASNTPEMSNAAFRLLWCFVLVLPWDVFIRVPVLGSIPRIVGIVASAVGVLYILARRRVRPLSWFHVFAILFVVWAGVSTFWSIDPDTTQKRFTTYLQLVVLVWLIWQIAWSPERRQALLGAYVLGVSVGAIAIVYSYVSGDSFRGTTRFTALSFDPNELALTLALGLPMAWHLSLAELHRRIAWLWRLYVPLAITAILLTASRGAFLTMLVALTIIPATQGRLRFRTGAGLYALAVGSLMLVTCFVPETSLERIRSTGADIEAGYLGGRTRIWHAGLEVAREHPLVGVGAGAFGVAIEPLFRSKTFGIEQESSHNALLAILVEEGIVGLFFFLAMVAALIKPLRHLPSLERRFGTVLLLALAVGSLSLTWDHRKQFWFVLGVLAAQVAQRPARIPASPAVARRASSRERLPARNS